MRTLIVSVAVGLLWLCGCSKRKEEAGAISDYSKARAAFKTTLLRQEPSPQPHGPVMTEQFREAGFAVMVPILRGENGQPGSFSMFYDEVDDVLAAARYLSAQPFVDPARLFLAGHSAGGTLTLLSAQASTQFRAAASLSGSPNQKNFLASGWNKMAPFDATNEQEVRMRSPQAFAESFKCPVRIYYGTEESFFAAASRDTARVARARSLDVESIAVPGAHFTAVPEEIALAIAFFRAQL